jgi:hypothetical protein
MNPQHSDRALPLDANAHRTRRSSNFLNQPFFLLVSTIRSEDIYVDG